MPDSIPENLERAHTASKDLESILKKILNIFRLLWYALITVAPILAILVSIRTCRIQEQSNNLAKMSIDNSAKLANKSIIVSLDANKLAQASNTIATEANELAQTSNTIATTANDLAKETSESAKKFDAIAAEEVWAILKRLYHDVDKEILIWENDNSRKRDGKSVDSFEELKTILEKLKVPNNIRDLYIKRHDSFLGLRNTADQYKQFKGRLDHIDFTLPSAPVLPRGTVLKGVSGSGFSTK